MAAEIERKFLLANDGWRGLASPRLIRQGYLTLAPHCIVRARISGPDAWLTVKGVSIDGCRDEYEYAVPLRDAEEMLDRLCQGPLIEKWRSRIPHAGLVWEVNEFLGENAGLMVAEVELERREQELALPSWIGREVTGDLRFHNSNLMKNPFSRWAASL